MTDAPKKITRTRPTNYPRQLVIMATDELVDAVETQAVVEGESKSVIARRWLEWGRALEAAGG